MTEEFGTKEFLIGTVAGVMIGASLAFIFAPKSGKELRGNINQRTAKMKYRVEEWMNIAQEKGTGFKEKAYTTAEEIRKMAEASRIGKVEKITPSEKSNLE